MFRSNTRSDPIVVAIFSSKLVSAVLISRQISESFLSLVMAFFIHVSALTSYRVGNDLWLNKNDPNLQNTKKGILARNGNNIQLRVLGRSRERLKYCPVSLDLPLVNWCHRCVIDVYLYLFFAVFWQFMMNNLIYSRHTFGVERLAVDAVRLASCDKRILTQIFVIDSLWRENIYLAADVIVKNDCSSEI